MVLYVDVIAKLSAFTSVEGGLESALSFSFPFV